MITKNTEIYSELSKKYNIHKAIISTICNHPFIFASRRISDIYDEKDLMFAYLFKLRLKKRFKGKKYAGNKGDREYLKRD
jgi:hypothetical protein